jgi:hypothetical protein
MLAKKLVKAGACLDPDDIANTDNDFKSLATAALAAAA